MGRPRAAAEDEEEEDEDAPPPDYDEGDEDEEEKEAARRRARAKARAREAEAAKASRKKTPEIAVRELERASRRVAELLTMARRSRAKPQAKRVRSDAPAAVRDPTVAAMKAAHDRLEAFFASRGAQRAPETSQGGEGAGAGAGKIVK
jgi:hypothetical protein